MFSKTRKEHNIAVWLDMEKAFDKVWKDGLKYELQKYGVSGIFTIEKQV
jgi:hypothetical protein